MINIITIWGLIILFLLQPGTAHEGAEAGARIFTHALLPYLLPYIILTQWLLKIDGAVPSNKPLWRRTVKAYVLGSFGGFPVGAVTVAEMTRNGELSQQQGALLLAACHAPGPMFIIGFVGTQIFGDIATGWKLLIAIHLANILFFIILLFFTNKEKEFKRTDIIPKTTTAQSPLLQAIKESSNIIILVATTVIFFSALGTVLSKSIEYVFTVDASTSQTIALSIFEMTSGVQAATINFSDLAIFPFLIAAVISLNGLSIHMQVVVIAKSASISLRPYFFGRLWSIIIVPILFYLLM